MNIIEKLDRSICLSSKYYGDKELDAFVYGILVGWDETDDGEFIVEEEIKKEFLRKFGWTETEWNIISTIKSCINVIRREND